MRTRRLIFFFVLGLFGAGCDQSGIHPLGQPRDVTTSCARSTWARSTDLGTELFLFGVEDPGGLSVDPETQETPPTCFVHAFVAHDKSTTLEQGTYTVDATGAGTFHVDFVFTYVYEPTLTTLTRTGSRRDDTPDPATHAIALATSGQQLSVSFDGEARLLTDFRRVLSRFDPKTQADAEVLFGAYSLPLYTTFARLVGFQATGMTEYIGSPATFDALVSGQFSVVVLGTLEPHNVFEFFAHEDLSGFVIDGRQDTYITGGAFDANGTMSGVLSFEMHGLDLAGETLLRGSVDYADVIIENGVAGGGFYLLALEDGSEYSIPWDVADAIDLRSVLPVAEGVP